MRGRFVLVLGQGRSGSTLIMRLLNAAPGVRISGENDRAFDGLEAFAERIAATRQDRDGSMHSIAWMAPPGIAELAEGLRALVLGLYNPERSYAVFGFKEIRYGQDYPSLERDIEFFRLLFPNLRVVLNVRDTEACLGSGWWADNPAESRATLDAMRQNFARYYQEHADYCYWMPYEELRKGSEVLRGMFEFLGISFRTEYESELSVVLR
jgi:hypothetical protein